MWFQRCDPSSEPQNPRALRARLAEVCSEGGNARGLSREGGGQASASVCARVCVGVSAGFLGMGMRGGMYWGYTGFRGNLSFTQAEEACESPPEIGREKSWRLERRRKEGRETCYTLSTAQIQRQSRRQNLDWICFYLVEGKKKAGVWGTFSFSHLFTFFIPIRNATFNDISNQLRNTVILSH